MSWDIFVQDLPEGITKESQIPDNFEPRSIGSREEILAHIFAVFPDSRWFDETCLNIHQHNCVLDIGIGKEDTCMGFALFVYGGDAAPGLIGELLQRLNLRALDTWSVSGLFDADKAVSSLRKHQAFRKQINHSSRE